MVHRCVINSVVMWLHTLVGPCWCVYVALFGSRLLPNSATYYDCTETYRSCFNVNFNIVFKTIIRALVGE